MVTVTERISALDQQISALESQVIAEQQSLREAQEKSPGGKFVQKKATIRDLGARADTLKQQRIVLRQLQQEVQAVEARGQTVTEEEQERQIKLREAGVRQAEIISLVHSRAVEARGREPELVATTTTRELPPRRITPEMAESRFMGREIARAEKTGIVFLKAEELQERGIEPIKIEGIIPSRGQLLVEQAEEIVGVEKGTSGAAGVPVTALNIVTPLGSKLLPIIEKTQPIIEKISEDFTFLDTGGARFGIPKTDPRTGEPIRVVAGYPPPIIPALPLSAMFRTAPARTQFVGVSQRVTSQGIISKVGFKTFAGKTAQVGRVTGISVVRRQADIFKVETFARGGVSRKILTSFGKVRLGARKAIAGVESGGGIIFKGGTSAQAGAGFVSRAGFFRPRATASPFISISKSARIGKITQTAGIVRTKFQTGIFGGAIKQVPKAPATFRVFDTGARTTKLAGPALKLAKQQALLQTKSIAVASSSLRGTVSPAAGAAFVLQKPQVQARPTTPSQPQLQTSIPKAKLTSGAAIQGTKPKFDQALKIISGEKMALATATGLAQPQALRTRQRVAQKQKISQAQVAIPLQAIAPATKTRLRAVQVSLQQMRFTPPTPPFTLLPRGIRMPGFFLPPLPSLSFPKERKGRVARERAFFRQPSFAAAQFRRTAIKPGKFEFTGLVERPLLR